MASLIALLIYYFLSVINLCSSCMKLSRLFSGWHNNFIMIAEIWTELWRTKSNFQTQRVEERCTFFSTGENSMLGLQTVPPQPMQISSICLAVEDFVGKRIRLISSGIVFRNSLLLSVQTCKTVISIPKRLFA